VAVKLGKICFYLSHTHTHTHTRARAHVCMCDKTYRMIYLEKRDNYLTFI